MESLQFFNSNGHYISYCESRVDFIEKVMLTRREFRYNFLLLRVILASKMIPLDFDREHGIITVPKSPWKIRISLGLFGVMIVRSFYILLRLLQVLLGSDEVVRHHLVLHADVSFAMFVIKGWFLSCFVLHPETFAALFNDAFADDCDDSQGKSIKGRSRQEWFALTMPSQVVLTILFSLWLFTYDRSMAMLLYSSLPASYKTPFWFCLLFSQELHLMAFIASHAILVLIVQILFFETITRRLKMLKMASGLLMWTEDMTERAYDELRKIQLQVNLFNNMNRFNPFSFKLYCIAMCTLNGYFMIVYFSANPVFGCMYYGIFGILCMLYSIIYERAFAIPKMVRQTKSMILLRAGDRVRFPGFKRRMAMRLRSVPEAGIQIGYFHTFERVATPVFVDYVLRNVMVLLAMHLQH